MINKEAIKILKDELKDIPPYCYQFDKEMKEYAEALDLAIKALEKIDKIENVNEIMCEDYSSKVRKILRGDV